MAIDGANLINSNVVYDTSHSMNNYNKILQQQQLKAQQEQKALMDELGSVKSDGIREGDKPVFYNKFDEWRNSAIQANKERDPQKRMMAQSDAEKKKLELVQLVNDSKQFGKNEDDFASRSLDNRFRVQFTDDAIQKAQQNRKLSITDPNYIKDYSTLQRQIDLSKVPDSIDKVRKILLNSSQFSNTTQDKLMKIGGKTWVDTAQTRSVPIEQQATVIGRHYDVEPDLQAYFVKKYPNLYDSLPTEQAKQQAIMTELSQYPPLEEKKISGRYLPNTPKGGDGADAKSTTYRQKLLDGIINNNSKSFDEVKAYMPTGAKISYETSKPTSQSKGGYNVIRIDIPAGVNAKGQEVPPLKEDISLSKGDYFNRLNNIVSLYTGEQISPSKANIIGGKPRGEQIEVKGTPKSTGKSYSTKYGDFTEEQLKSTYGDAWKKAYEKIKK